MFYDSRNGRELDCHWNPKRWFEFYNKIKWKDVASAARAATATVSEINKVMELNGGTSETQRRPFGYKTQRLLLHQAKMSHSQIPSVARSNMCSTNRRAGGRWTLNVISESVFETEHWVNTSSRWAAGLHFQMLVDNLKFSSISNMPGWICLKYCTIPSRMFPFHWARTTINLNIGSV